MKDMERDGCDSGDKNKRIFGRSAVRLFVRENGKRRKVETQRNELSYCYR